ILRPPPASTPFPYTTLFRSIGMAVISEPSLLLLDEPTCGMSPAETNRAVEKIRDLARTIDIVIIEHDMDVVFGIADDITVLAQRSEEHTSELQSRGHLVCRL